ncbi:unnamed protein product [Ectocarpus sp. 4 AP-2014]
MALLDSVGLGSSGYSEQEAWDVRSRDAVARTLLTVCRRGYNAQDVKKVIEGM